MFDGGHYAAVFGIELDELLELERLLLGVLKWNLFFTDETYTKHDKQLGSTFGTIQILNNTAIGLGKMHDGDVSLVRRFTKCLVVQVLNTLGFMIFSARLPSRKTCSGRYIELNVPSLHLPLAEIGMKPLHMTQFADSCARFSRSIRWHASSAFSGLMTCVKFDQTEERASSDIEVRGSSLRHIH